MGFKGMCVHASPVPRQGKHLLSNGTGKDLFLNLQFLIMLWPDVKVVPIWHGCKLKSQAIKISSFSCEIRGRLISYTVLSKAELDVT